MAHERGLSIIGGRAVGMKRCILLRGLHVTAKVKVYKKKPCEFSDLTREQRATLSSFLRVNQAGELAANSIYEGQILVLKSDPETKELLTHMLEQEKRHLEVFDSLIARNCVRPSLLRGLWYAAGYALGVTTASISKEAAMACTEAVETTIGHHYNNQLRILMQFPSDKVGKLVEIIKQFRDEELEHLDIAIQRDADKAPAYPVLKSIVSTGCKTAIWIAERI